MNMRNLLAVAVLGAACSGGAIAQVTVSGNSIDAACQRALVATSATPLPPRWGADAATCLASPRANEIAAQVRRDLAQGRSEVALAQAGLTVASARRIAELSTVGGRDEINVNLLLALVAMRNANSDITMMELSASAAMRARQIMTANAISPSATSGLPVWVVLLTGGFGTSHKDRGAWLEAALPDLQNLLTTSGATTDAARSMQRGLLGRTRAYAAAASADWPRASSLYNQLTDDERRSFTSADTGQMDVLMRALFGIQMQQAGSIDVEHASVAAMVDDFDGATRMLERSRRAFDDAREPEDALAQLKRLTDDGEIVVQIGNSLVGTVVLASRKIRGKLGQVVIVDTDQGGMTVPMFTINQGGDRGDLPLPSYGPPPSSVSLLAVYEALRRPVVSNRTLGWNAHAELGFAASRGDRIVGRAVRGALRILRARKDDRVVVILPPNLALLPFGHHAIAGEEPLPLRYEMRFAPSLSVAARRHVPASASMAATIISPELATNDLPALALEAAAIRRALGARARDARDFAAASADSGTVTGARIYHFQGHGVWDPRNRRGSGLIQSGPRPLSVTDISSTRFTDGPRLVFLAACETGLIGFDGNPNDYLSLQTAFLRAGSKAVIGSLWSVDDSATALLTARFYDELAKGAAPAAALRAAQVWIERARTRDLRGYVQTLAASALDDEAALLGMDAVLFQLQRSQDRDRPFSNPYYWAGFRLYGR